VERFFSGVSPVITGDKAVRERKRAMLRKLFIIVLALLVPSLCPAENAVFNPIPFDRFWGPTRYQQVFDASLFPPEGAYIDQISFIPDSPGEYGAAVEIRLSHTTALPGELSPAMDENVTGTEEVVFSDPEFYQVLKIDAQDPDNPVSQNSPYGLIFNLDFPFLYNPDEGSLLMEINISNQSRSLSMLGVIQTTPCLTSRAYESQYGPGVDATPTGLDTLFTLSAAPAYSLLVADSPQVVRPPTDNVPFRKLFGNGREVGRRCLSSRVSAVGVKGMEKDAGLIVGLGVITTLAVKPVPVLLGAA
jgi:hypothetical protein